MLDDAMEKPGDEEEADKIVSQVLDGIGIDNANIKYCSHRQGFGCCSAGAGTETGTAASSNSASGGGGNDSDLSDLEARLSNFNNDKLSLFVIIVEQRNTSNGRFLYINNRL